MCWGEKYIVIKSNCNRNTKKEKGISVAPAGKDAICGTALWLVFLYFLSPGRNFNHFTAR
jgi:hypothetical protein